MTDSPSTGTADPLGHRSVDEFFAAVSGARRNARRRAWWVLAVVTGFLLSACQASPQTNDAGTAANHTPAPAEQRGPAGAAPSGPIAAVCDNQVPGPPAAPAGAVVVDPAVDNDLAAKTEANQPGTTFWLAPGTHTLGRDQYGQVSPKDGNRYIGARARFSMGAD